MTTFQPGETLAVHPDGARLIAYMLDGRTHSALYLRGDFVKPHPAGGWGVSDQKDGRTRRLPRTDVEQLRQIAPGPHQPPLIPAQAGILAEEPRDDPGIVVPLLRAQQISSRLLDPDTVDQLADPGWLIEGYIPAGGLFTIFGKPGSYKTFLALDWACSVATGSWWQRHRVTAGPSMYVMAEGSGGLRRRKQAWEQANRTPLRGFPIRWYPKPVNLLDRDWAEGLAIAAEELGAVLVVIDTVARAMPGGDENTSRDMGALISAADLIRERTRGAVGLVHHTPLDGGRLRGHSSLEGAVDTNIGVESDGTTVTVTVDKQKDAEPPRALHLHPEPFGESIALRAGPNTDGGLPEAALKTLRALDDIDLGEGATSSAWITATSLPPRTFHRTVKRLLETGHCHTLTGQPGERGARYTATEQGKEVLGR